MGEEQVMENHDDNIESREPLFVNQCTYTKAVLLEFRRRTRPVWLRGLMAFLEILFALFAVIFFFTGRENYPAAAEMLLLSLILWSVSDGIPRLRISRSVKQTQSVYHTLSRVTVSFYEDGFASFNETSGAKASMRYADIIRLMQSKGFYFLKMEHQMYHILDKDGFQKGTAVEFERFMKEKLG